MATKHKPGSTSVVRPTLLYISRMLKKVFTCHPERSEGSHVFEKARSFAALRMTIKVKRFMTHHTSWLRSSRRSFNPCNRGIRDRGSGIRSPSISCFRLKGI